MARELCIPVRKDNDMSTQQVSMGSQTGIQ